MKITPNHPINITLFIIYCILNMLQYVLIPLWLLPINLWWGLLLIPGVLITNTFWALLHEGIHNMLVADRKKNIAFSRIMSFFHGSPFYLLRFGHLMHHQFNRTHVDRTEVYETKKDNYLLVSLRYYFTICGGLYLAEVIGAWATFLPRQQLLKLTDNLFNNNPRINDICQRLLLKPSTLRSMRIDAICILALLAISFSLYSTHGWMLLLALFWRGFLISWADNLPHYGTPLDDITYAYNLKAPRWRQYMLLNFNLHRVHHHYPTVPWHLLPTYFEKDLNGYDHAYFAIGFSQFRGPIASKDLRQQTTDHNQLMTPS